MPAKKRRLRADRRIYWPKFGALESAPYGMLNVRDLAANNPQVYRLWLTRHKEPEPSPEFGMRLLMVLEDDDDKAPMLARQIMAMSRELLTGREYMVLQYRFVQDLTLQEVADCMMVTRERIRQLQASAIRIISAAIRRGEVDGRSAAFKAQEAMKRNEHEPLGFAANKARQQIAAITDRIVHDLQIGAAVHGYSTPQKLGAVRWVLRHSVSARADVLAAVCARLNEAFAVGRELEPDELAKLVERHASAGICTA